ncbi:MAG: HAD family hydrolase [Candidatus Nanohaloarchaea archaeon]
MYDGVIFDKDGVLLDSSIDGFEWFDRARVEEAKKRGHELTVEEAKSIIKAGTVEELQAIKEEKGFSWEELSEIERAISERKNQRIRKGEIDLFPGTEKVLEESEVAKAVVSNAPWHTTSFVIEHFGLESHFAHVESPSLNDIREYVRRKKPNPVMVENALAEMEAEKVVMVGDSSDDIQVAENAGIDSCLVNGRDYSGPEPDHRLNSLEDILDLIS